MDTTPAAPAVTPAPRYLGWTGLLIAFIAFQWAIRDTVYNDAGTDCGAPWRPWKEAVMRLAGDDPTGCSSAISQARLLPTLVFILGALMLLAAGVWTAHLRSQRPEGNQPAGSADFRARH